jgi:hypothetical protein
MPGQSIIRIIYRHRLIQSIGNPSTTLCLSSNCLLRGKWPTCINNLKIFIELKLQQVVPLFFLSLLSTPKLCGFRTSQMNALTERCGHTSFTNHTWKTQFLIQPEICNDNSLIYEQDIKSYWRCVSVCSKHQTCQMSLHSWNTSLSCPFTTIGEFRQVFLMGIRRQEIWQWKG